MYLHNNPTVPLPVLASLRIYPSNLNGVGGHRSAACLRRSYRLILVAVLVAVRYRFW